MDTDKILIVLALAIALTVFALKEPLMEDVELLRDLERKNLVEELSLTYFYPLSQRERIEILQDHIHQMSEFRKKGLFVRPFVDFEDYIAEREKNLQELTANLSQNEDFVSFSTRHLNNVLATLDFSKEELLALGCLIDQVFPEDEGTALYELGWSDNRPLLVMSLFEDFPPVKKSRYREFARRLSEDIFDGEPVVLHVYPFNSEKKLVFKGGGQA